MIDLHTHTWYSDGTQSPCDLVKAAAEKRIDTLSITDHDGTFGLEEGAAEAARLGIRFINGIEFSGVLSQFIHPSDPSHLGAVYMHILGYDFDPKHPPLLERVRDIREQRRARNEKMLQTFEQLGYPLEKEDLEVYPGQDYMGKPNVARALVKRGYAASVSEAFASEKLMSAPEIKAIHREKIEVAQAIGLIVEAGGFAALAHPYQVTYKGKKDDSDEEFFHKLGQIVGTLMHSGLAGMECYYSSHTKEQERRLLQLAAEHKLQVTAGSDYHGPGMKKNVVLGGIHGS